MNVEFTYPEQVASVFSSSVLGSALWVIPSVAVAKFGHKPDRPSGFRVVVAFFYALAISNTLVSTWFVTGWTYGLAIARTIAGLLAWNLVYRILKWVRNPLQVASTEKFMDSLKQEDRQDYIEHIEGPAMIVLPGGGAGPVNKAFTELLGVKTDDVVGLGWTNFVTPDDRTHVIHRWWPFAVEQIKSVEIECHWEHPTKGVLLIRLRGVENSKSRYCRVQDASGNLAFQRVMDLIGG